MSQSVLRAAAATSWSRRYTAAVPGTLAITRSAMCPAGAARSRASREAPGAGDPAASAHIRANASSSAATAGPRTATPVSRQGSIPRAGSPTQ